MSNCKPGDLAIVVKAHNACNIGTILKVLRPNRNQSALYTARDDVLWLVEAPHPMTYDYWGTLRRRRKGPVPDSYLRPIRGNPKNEEITRVEPLKADSSEALTTARRNETERQTCEN